MFRGLKWNPRTQSCAYDSVLSVISNVYLHNARNWQESMGGINSLLSGVIQEWAKAIQYAEFNKMEAARDALQAKLNSEDSISFPISGGHTDLGHLLAKLMRDDSGTQWKYARKCGHCNREETPLISGLCVPFQPLELRLLWLLRSNTGLIGSLHSLEEPVDR